VIGFPIRAVNFGESASNRLPSLFVATPVFRAVESSVIVPDKVYLAFLGEGSIPGSITG